jgi:hypothetical protein
VKKKIVRKLQIDILRPWMHKPSTKYYKTSLATYKNATHHRQSEVYSRDVKWV